MDRRAYDKIYLNTAMSTLASMLDYAVCVNNKNIDSVMNLFVTSGIAAQYENGSPALIAGKSGIEIHEMLYNCNRVANIPNVSMSRSAEYWLGWSLAYYQWYSCRTFSEIIRTIPASSMVMWYYTLHEADLNAFVDKAETYFAQKPTNLELIRKQLGMSQVALSQLSNVPVYTIRSYESRQADIGKAQFNILSALCKVLGCTPLDLLDSSLYGNNNYLGQEDFMATLRQRTISRQQQLYQLQGTSAQLEDLRMSYQLGYMSQFPSASISIRDSQPYINVNDYINNWNNYWYSIASAHTKLPNLDYRLQESITAAGKLAIDIALKQINNPVLSTVHHGISLLNSKSLEEAMYNVISLIMAWGNK